MHEIAGVITRGGGTASKNLVRQMPHLGKYAPGIETCHLGTINLSLDRSVRIYKPDVTTDPIPWRNPPERFDLTKIEIQPPGSAEWVTAWVYGPHDSPWREKQFLLEIIAPRLEVSRGSLLKLRFLRHMEEVPGLRLV